jgi:ABC-type polar amino acid transport system ATPase subunit
MPPEPATTPVLEARGLTKRFDTLVALDAVSIAVAPGTVTAILGPSGSGKSTLLRCLNFLVVPDGGEVRFDGKLVNPRDDAALNVHRARVGMVFQQFNLFPHLLVWENVALAVRLVRKLSAEAARKRALALLERVGLADKADAHPAQLSGGQQQRAAIARALAVEPAVLLFDEPTSALDPELTGEVSAVMRQLAAEHTTMVVVTHDVEFARQAATEVVFMDAGRVIETGPPAQVIDAPATERARRFFSLKNAGSGWLG